MTETKRRSRRSSATVDVLILNAARQLFAERGYRASTRDIAQLAAVPEPLLFRKFGSKARLFEKIVSDALLSFYEEFEAKHLAGLGDEAVLARRGFEFTEELVALITQNRELIFSYLSAAEFEPDLAEMPVSEALTNYFDRADQSLRRRYETLKLQPSIRPAVSARLGFLTVVAVVLFKDWVLRDVALSREELLRSLNNFVLRDFPAEPPTASAEPRAATRSKSDEGSSGSGDKKPSQRSGGKATVK